MSQAGFGRGLGLPERRGSRPEGQAPCEGRHRAPPAPPAGPCTPSTGPCGGDEPLSSAVPSGERRHRSQARRAPLGLCACIFRGWKLPAKDTPELERWRVQTEPDRN